MPNKDTPKKPTEYRTLGSGGEVIFGTLPAPSQADHLGSSDTQQEIETPEPALGDTPLKAGAFSPQQGYKPQTTTRQGYHEPQQKQHQFHQSNQSEWGGSNEHPKPSFQYTEKPKFQPQAAHMNYNRPHKPQFNIPTQSVIISFTAN